MTKTELIHEIGYLVFKKVLKEKLDSGDFKKELVKLLADIEICEPSQPSKKLNNDFIADVSCRISCENCAHFFIGMGANEGKKCMRDKFKI